MSLSKDDIAAIVTIVQQVTASNTDALNKGKSHIQLKIERDPREFIKVYHREQGPQHWFEVPKAHFYTNLLRSPAYMELTAEEEEKYPASEGSQPVKRRKQAPVAGEGTSFVGQVRKLSKD